MKLHPRTLDVQGASSRIRSILIDLQERHGLTDAEMLGVLTEAQQSTIKYVLRAERHPGNLEHKADEACDESCAHNRVGELDA